MIKGLGYLKYLKQSLIGFGISCFILLGGSFVNAGSFPAIGMNSQLSDGNNCVINEDLSISCDKSNHAFTNIWDGGGAKSISSIFWSEDGIGILHNNSDSGYNIQGLITDGFHICSGNTQNYMQGNSDWFATCPGNFETVGNYTYEELIAILKSKKPLYWWNATQYAGTFLTIIYDGFYFSVGINGYGRSQTHLNGNFVSKDLGFSNSLSYSGINWNNVNILSSPTGYGGNLNGSITGGFNNLITGDTIDLFVSYQELLDYLESAGYSKYLCYGGIDNFDLYDSSINYNVIPGTGKTLGQIWGYSSSRAWDTFDEWFRFWNGLYIDENNNYNAMWSSYPAVYHSWFDMYYQYGGQYLVPRTIFEYCQVKLGFSTGTLQNGSCGGYFTPICNSIVEQKQNGTWNGSYYTSGDEQLNNGVGTNWNGVGIMTGITEQKTAVNFIQDFFNKAKSVIPTNYSGKGGGFLPGYIILFMLALILFRFLSH